MYLYSLKGVDNLLYESIVLKFLPVMLFAFPIYSIISTLLECCIRVVVVVVVSIIMPA